MADETNDLENYDTGEFDLADDENTDNTSDENESEPWDEDRARKAMNKKNRENQSLRERLKKLEPLEQEFKERQEKEKTAEQKFAELSASKSKVEQDYWRAEIALEKGLTLTQAKRLVGSTKEELLEDADALMNDLGLSGREDVDTPALTRRGKELRGGSEPEPTAKLDAEKIAQSLYGF